MTTTLRLGLLIPALLTLTACAPPAEPVMEAPIVVETRPIEDTSALGSDDCKVVPTLTGDGIGGTGCPAVE